MSSNTVSAAGLHGPLGSLAPCSAESSLWVPGLLLCEGQYGFIVACFRLGLSAGGIRTPHTKILSSLLIALSRYYIIYFI